MIVVTFGYSCKKIIPISIPYKGWLQLTILAVTVEKCFKLWRNSVCPMVVVNKANRSVAGKYSATCEVSRKKANGLNTTVMTNN